MVSIRLPYHFAKTFGMMISMDNPAYLYYLANPSLGAISEICRVFQTDFLLQEIDQKTFQKELARCYESSNSVLDAAEDIKEDIDLSRIANEIPMTQDLLDSQNDAPVIRLLNALFTQAIKQKASDIHIETYEHHIIVRVRVDGILQEILEISRAIAPLVISRIKVMAKLDIAEKRLPQDGRISISIGGHAIDVRVSTLPSNHGERVVLRLLDKESAQLNLSLLGMPDNTLNIVKNLIHQPHGIILVTGPTGSGKTTSLYAMLTEINQATRNILTIEDPIEYDLPGIGQTHVNTKINMTFAKGLRAILRQDPDVVMIGEIRDLETVDIAIQASLTGHLVLSTLHTNSALGALTRLMDMGVESFLLSSSLTGLIAQRLVRTLCPYCKIAHKITADEKIIMGLSEDEKNLIIYEPKGCEHCNYLGYKGRTGIYEVIRINEVLKKMIHKKDSLQQLETYLREETPSMRQDGFSRVLKGDTTLSEILRVTSED